MPISDFVLSLALALHPTADGKPVVLSADALVQPVGGVQVAMDDASSKDASKAFKTDSISKQKGGGKTDSRRAPAKKKYHTFTKVDSPSKTSK